MNSTRRKPFAAVAGLLFLALMSGANPAHSDQTDPRLAQLFALLGDARSAGEARQLEQEIWEIWFESKSPNAVDSLNQARGVAQAGAVSAALEMFNKLVEDYPDFAEGWNQRAIVRYLSGDVAGSLDDIERALALEPRHFGALSGRGQCYISQKRYREALNAFEEALNINPWIGTVSRQIEMLKAYLEGQRQNPI